MFSLTFHHSALLRSLILLFEGRLGMRVFRPIGMEWREKGFWNVFDHDATAAQFLSLAQGHRPTDGTPPLNEFVDMSKIRVRKSERDVYFCADPENSTYNKAITFEKFLATDIDIIIATLPQHVEPFKRLIRLYKPNAKLVLQVGNNWEFERMDVKNVLASIAPRQVPAGMNAVFYHQEFDLDTFHATSIPQEPNVYSFVNILQNTSDYPLYLRYKELMPDYNFKAFGGQCPDGVINGVRNLADKMREARFIWHVKPGGDGFGHVIHNAFAVGRPVITRKSHYKGCLAEKLLEDGVTCIDLDMRSEADNLKMIREMAQPDHWQRMAGRVYTKFRQTVDYMEESQKIRAFLKNLV